MYRGSSNATPICGRSFSTPPLAIAMKSGARSSPVQNKPSSNKAARMPNRLAHETSPYLLQHQHNPVDWHPWSAEAIDRAKAEQKPIFLSVGYSACHWCHVMEHESFENDQIA